MPAFTLYLDNRPVATTAPDTPPPPTPRLTEWQAVEFHCMPPPGATLTLRLVGPLHTITLQPFLRPGDPAWRWHWNPQNIVGHFALHLDATDPHDTHPSVRAALEVVPSKLAQQHYTRLLQDLRQIAHTLAYALTASSVGVTLQPDDTEGGQQTHVLEEFCRFYTDYVTRLERAVAQIAPAPYTVLRQQTERVPLERIHDLSQADIAAVTRALAAGAADQESALPLEVEQATSTPHVDTYENRLLKQLIAQSTQRVQQMAAAAAHLAATTDTTAVHTLVERSAALTERMHQLRMLPFLAHIGPLRRFNGTSHLMRRDTPYRQVYQLWQELRHSPVLAVESPLFALPIHALPQLYEYWCVLRTARALLELPGAVLRMQRLVHTAHPDAPAFANRLELTSDHPLLALDWRGGHISLRYQPRYYPTDTEAPVRPVSLDSHTHIPDMALEWLPPTGEMNLLILDAKYRLDASGSVPADALADAYTYLGSIGLPDGAGLARQVVLLYPGQGAAEHYRSGVGIMPLLPDHSAPFRAWLHGWLDATASNH